MGSKVYEAPTLKAATKERAQHYEELREQFVGLKKEFGKIVDDGQFQGHGAEAIKGFYLLVNNKSEYKLWMRKLLR